METKQLSGILSSISDTYAYNEEDFQPYRTNYQFVYEFATNRQMVNTSLALPLVRGILVAAPWKEIPYKKDAALRLGYYAHSLEIARMLIDLDVPLSREETDLVIAAGLCHVLIELIRFEKGGQELIEAFHLDPRVLQIIQLITRNDPLSEEEQRRFYLRIQENKLAILARLADRGNLVERLHTMTIWTAQEYVHETRTYFFPMCIYAKEHYPELASVVGILMEKMRYMIEVADILTNRFREHENTLTKEILELKEENARIRSLLKKLRASEAETN